MTCIPFILVFILLVYVALLIVYYVFITRAIVQMLQHNAHTILLIFSFISLLPFPPMIIMGILIMIIWGQLRKAHS